jgi:hypothetical protein
MATIFIFIIILGLLGAFGLPYLDERHIVSKGRPSRMHRTHYSETIDTGFGG